jgi:hypothetical protein
MMQIVSGSSSDKPGYQQITPMQSISDRHGSRSPDSSGSDAAPYFHIINVCGTTPYNSMENVYEEAPTCLV